MNNDELKQFLSRFCEATDCEIHEKTDSHMTVKLSEEADRQLTGRPYYWMFVDRTGEAAQTMTMRWQYGKQPEGAQSDKTSTGASYGSHLPQLVCDYGGEGWERIVRACRERGRFVRLFEHGDLPLAGGRSRALQTWACFQLKIEFVCDLKKEVLLSVGINLQTGKMLGDFHKRMLARDLRPQLPPRIFLSPDLISLDHAWQKAVQTAHEFVSAHDDCWAVRANERMTAELEASEHYFSQLLMDIAKHDMQALDEQRVQERLHLEEQRQTRMAEIRRQFAPLVRISLLNGGLFHLNPASNISNAV
jgi:hypothetical protein